MSSGRFGRITVAIDGSPNATQALDEAIDLAKTYQSELTILAVSPFVPIYMPTAGPYVTTEAAASELPRYQHLVDTAVKKAEDAGVVSVTGLCVEGVVVDEILSYLELHPSNLVVVGSRGLSATKRLLIGSVSGALVNHAPCPVLVVRVPPVTKNVPG